MNKSVLRMMKTTFEKLLIGILMFVALIIFAVAVSPPRAGGIQVYPR